MHTHRSIAPRPATLLLASALGSASFPSPAGSGGPQIPPLPDVVINEVLVDPGAGPEGDANGDGIRDTYQDEFIELVNRGGVCADLSGWLLGAEGGALFTFPDGTVLAPGGYLTLFGGGDPAALPGPAMLGNGRIGNGLSNAAGRLLLIDPAGPDTLQDIAYLDWDTDSSHVRVPEAQGPFTDHMSVFGVPFSPTAPSLSQGGPFSTGPAIYRPRVVNLTSSGFEIAWRTPTPADARLELNLDQGPRHIYATAPLGLLHRAGHYGLAPLTEVPWRIVSAGTPYPAEGMLAAVTAQVATSVPYTVYGTLTGAGGPSGQAQVFLQAQRGGSTSGWLLAETDSLGRWTLNLGNLRRADGGSYTWQAGDSLHLEADGGAAGIATAVLAVLGTSPQELPLPELVPDPAPLFSWLTGFQAAVADTALTLEYALVDPAIAWATLLLVSAEGGEEIAVPTLPPRLERAAAGSVTLLTGALPEGSRWHVAALVEDGLNPPLRIVMGGVVTVAHAVARRFDVPAGVRLLTPTLDDPALRTASGWLAGLPATGEMARWDTASASWVSASRLADGTIIGPDFAMVPGEGYALVSAIAGTLGAVGPRHYAPPPFEAHPGLALVGVADSASARWASQVLASAAIRAVSRWDVWSQRWEGSFRLPDGSAVGIDFPIGWGDAVAVESDAALPWQPVAPPAAALSEPVVPLRAPASTHRPVLWAMGDAPGGLRVLWQGAAGSRLVLRDAGGREVRTIDEGARAQGWVEQAVGGVAAGDYVVELIAEQNEGRVRLRRQVRVASAAPPQLPRWMWGQAPAGEAPLLLESASGIILARRDGRGHWYAPLTIPPPHALVALAEDGGWDRWTLHATEAAAGPVAVAAEEDPLSVSGLDVKSVGPMALEVACRVLRSPGALSLRLFLGYESPSPGGGPPDDPRIWVPAGSGGAWRPDAPSDFRERVHTGPGPGGVPAPEAIALRLGTGEGEFLWVGPAALTVPDASDEGLALLPAVPNPFNPETAVRYRLPPGAERFVRLEVRDVRGRRIRTLREGREVAGLHMVRWDGRDGQGRRVAAGIYLILLEVEGRRLSRKVLLLK